MSAIIGSVCYEWRDYILLASASITGTVFLFLMLRVSHSSIKHPWVGVGITGVFFFLGFHKYMFYMNEFKADSLILIYSCCIAVIIDRIEQNKVNYNIPTAILLFVFALLMDVTKQQALYIDVALGLYLLFSKKMCLKKRLSILTPLILAGVTGLVIIFSIPGLEITAILNLKEMPFFRINRIIAMSVNLIKCNCVFIIFLIIFMVLWLKKKILLNGLEQKWLIIVSLFAAAQFAGGVKVGGNEGNFEIGIIGFLPFAIAASDYLFDKFVRDNHKPFLMLIGQLGILAVLIVYDISVVSSIPGTIMKKISLDNTVSDYLTEKCGGEKIMYNSDNYMRVIGSKAIPGMDVYTVPLYLPEYVTVIEDALSSKEYKYLYIVPSDFKDFDCINAEYQGIETQYYALFEHNYTPVNDISMPEELKEKLYVIK